MGKKVKREWGKEKKKKTYHAEGCLTAHTSILWAGQQRLQINHTVQIKSLSQIPQRKPFQKRILRVLFSPNTVGPAWMGSTQSNMAFRFGNQWDMESMAISIYGVRWKLRRQESESCRILSLPDLLSLWASAAWCERVSMDSKWSPNPFRLLFHLICILFYLIFLFPI